MLEFSCRMLKRRSSLAAATLILLRYIGGKSNWGPSEFSKHYSLEPLIKVAEATLIRSRQGAQLLCSCDLRRHSSMTLFEVSPGTAQCHVPTCLSVRSNFCGMRDLNGAVPIHTSLSHPFGLVRIQEYTAQNTVWSSATLPVRLPNKVCGRGVIHLQVRGLWPAPRQKTYERSEQVAKRRRAKASSSHIPQDLR